MTDIGSDLSDRARPPRSSDIVMMDAGALASAIRARQVSCVEAMSAYLDHIERLNPRVNAIVALVERATLPGGARGRAPPFGGGEGMGRFHGLPNGVKN